MKNEKKFKPVQPYLLIDTDNYKQATSSIKDISHFYSLSLKANSLIRIVPDGSMDMIFIRQGNKTKVFVLSFKMRYEEIPCKEAGDIFGIRFMPALVPRILGNKMNYLNNSLEKYTSKNSYDCNMVGKIMTEKHFEKRIKLFCDWYETCDYISKMSEEKQALIEGVREKILSSGGKSKIAELSEKVIYSERYINKVFNDSFGLSPKMLCKVIQFQHALEYLDYGYPENMTEAAVELGYYDQSQFIKDFSSSANCTPKKYYMNMENYNYKESIKDCIKEIMV